MRICAAEEREELTADKREKEVRERDLALELEKRKSSWAAKWLYAA